MPFAQERLKFEKPPRLFLRNDQKNADNPLGKTAFYDPQNQSITLYTTGRHVKDVMRSLAHELVHHTQNCRGDFDGEMSTEPGYAQNDEHLRNMEREAYEMGNMCFRDWEDSIKNTIQYEHLQKGENKMSTKDWKNDELKSLLSEAWGFGMDLNKLNENVETEELEEQEEGNIEEDLGGLSGDPRKARRPSKDLSKAGKKLEPDETTNPNWLGDLGLPAKEKDKEMEEQNIRDLAAKIRADKKAQKDKTGVHAANEEVEQVEEMCPHAEPDFSMGGEPEQEQDVSMLIAQAEEALEALKAAVGGVGGEMEMPMGEPMMEEEEVVAEEADQVEEQQKETTNEEKLRNAIRNAIKEALKNK